MELKVIRYEHLQAAHKFELNQTLFTRNEYIEAKVTTNLKQILLCRNKPIDKKCSTYDLVSVVKRQSPFFYQVSKRIQTLVIK